MGYTHWRELQLNMASTGRHRFAAPQLDPKRWPRRRGSAAAPPGSGVERLRKDVVAPQRFFY